jgi:hypothetical protein
MGEPFVRKVLVAIVFFVAFPLLLAQQTLNNDSVVKMVKMGFPDDMIVNAINRSPGIYDTSPAGLAAVKNAGVGDKAVAAMVFKETATAPPTPTAPAQAAPSQDVPPPAASTPLAPAPTSPPTAPPAAQQPPRAAYAPSANRPRVFLQAQSHGSLWNATRDQSMEMSKDFERNCPGVRISINQQMADYTVALNHIEHGLARDN